MIFNIYGEEITLRTSQVQQEHVPMNIAERVLQAVTDPNVAYLLMTIALIGIIAELYNPGALFPGITGVISLVLALSALGSLPLNWAGLALIVLGIVFLAVDLYTDGMGILAVFGLIGFVLGSLFLYQPLTPVSPVMATVEVSRWLILLIVIFIFSFFVFVLGALLKVRRTPIAMGSKLMIGKNGVVKSTLSPKGIIKIDGEEWSAIIDQKGSGHDIELPIGSYIEVVGMEGLVLKVRRANH